MRIFAIVPFIAACSLLTVKGPSAERPRDCTLYARPQIVVDGTLFVLGALGTGGLVSDGSQKNDGGEIVGGVLVGAAAVVMLVSSIVGIQRTDACRRAWQE